MPCNQPDAQMESSDCDLFEIAHKLRGIGELLKNQSREALLSQDSTYGLGIILEEIADKIVFLKGNR